MTYGLLALFIVIIILSIMDFLRKRKKSDHLPKVDNKNRRRSFRIKFENSFCDFQPIAASSKLPGIMRDISAEGIGIETTLPTLYEGSLLMLYFDLDEESFIFEGIVKRKQILDNGLVRYGIQFINSTAYIRENLYKKLWAIERQRAQ